MRIFHTDIQNSKALVILNIKNKYPIKVVFYSLSNLHINS